jgi:hypothetical protein
VVLQIEYSLKPCRTERHRRGKLPMRPSSAGCSRNTFWLHLHVKPHRPRTQAHLPCHLLRLLDQEESFPLLHAVWKRIPQSLVALGSLAFHEDCGMGCSESIAAVRPLCMPQLRSKAPWVGAAHACAQGRSLWQSSASLHGRGRQSEGLLAQG